MSGSKRSTERLQLGPAAVLSVSRAAELLPVGDDRARSWMHYAGLIRDLGGGHAEGAELDIGVETALGRHTVPPEGHGEVRDAVALPPLKPFP